MKTGFFAFLLACWDRASKGTVLLTDRFSIILFPLGTVVFWGMQKIGIVSTRIELNVTELVSFVLVFTVFGMILVRLAISPYLVWRDQNGVIDRLNSDLAAPEYIERKWLADYVAQARGELSKSLARMSYLSSKAYIWIEREGDHSEEVKDMKNEFFKAKELSYIRCEELSYIPNLRDELLGFINACERLIQDTKDGGPARETKKEVADKRNAVLRTLHHR